MNNEKHYNRGVKVRELHGWQVNVREAMDLQRQMAAQVIKSAEPLAPRLVAGLDIAVGKKTGTARGAAAVLRYPDLELVEVQTAEGPVTFPYVPGLLSFREAPLTLEACARLSVTPDLFLVDGQGYAHPRRFGLACHLGLFLDKPTIGCAKSVLLGNYEEPEAEAGSYTPIVDNDETIGAALRTQTGVKPLYVSIGHEIDLPTAIYWTLQCCKRHRLPEPARLAHLAASGAHIKI